MTEFNPYGRFLQCDKPPQIRIKEKNDKIMNNKEFKIIDEEYISYSGGTAIIISDGECKIPIWETKDEVQKICDYLNTLHKLNNYID